jgi:2-methylcitrate dehydratase
MQIRFKDGSSTPKVEVEFPIGHRRRRAEAAPVLRRKFVASLERRFPKDRQERILAVCDAPAVLDGMPVDDFVSLFVPTA